MPDEPNPLDAPWLHSERCHRRRRAAVFLGHAPGFWLATGEPLPRSLWLANAVVGAATLVAMIAAAVVATPWWLGLIAAWLLGHLAWSAYAAWRLPRRSPAGSRPAAARARFGLRCDDACGPR